MTAQFSTRADRIESVIQGEQKVSGDPAIVFSTILGSCVAVCLYDDVAKIGGMNHYLLPFSSTASSTDRRYGALAMELLINELLKAGAVRSRIKAKLFGGARVTSAFSDIGQKNVEFGRQFLQQEGFSITGEDLGGTQARRVHFRATTGAVKLVTVANSNAADEKPRRPRFSEKPERAITLF